MARVTTWPIVKAMVEAGIFTEEEMGTIRRIVIDLDYRSCPIMYIERWMDDKFISVLTTLDGIDIRREEKPDGYDTGDSGEGEPVVEEQGEKRAPDPIREFTNRLDDTGNDS